MYHRARFREFAWYNHRDHRKIAVIDGRIGYTVGHGIADMWRGRPDSPAGWRDTAARFEGPAVNALQSGFFENWTRTTGEALAGARYFPRLERAGNVTVHVRIMLPTAATSDFAIVQHASHAYYGPLMERGVEVYEYTLSGLHQKVMVIDGTWCTIGSTNFDRRSFRINDEVTVAIHDARIAGELRACFDEDAKSAHRWTLQEWESRSMAHKVKDRAAALMKRQL